LLDRHGDERLGSSELKAPVRRRAAGAASASCWWYEAVDAQGELHRGAPSVKMFVTMTGGPRSFSMAIPTCRLTKFGVMRICVARTEAGAIEADSQLPLYRCTAVPAGEGNGW
jgi:hypothetical protein